MSFQLYLEEFKALKLELLDESPVADSGQAKSVRTVWKKSFEAVQAKSSESAELLRLCAFFAPERIPFELFHRGAPELGGRLGEYLARAKGSDRILNRLLTPLARYSLIRRDTTARVVDVHRLVQAVIQSEMVDAARREHAERAVRALDRAFPSPDFRTWSDCDRLISHAVVASRWIDPEGLVFAEVARLLENAGTYLFQRAQYQQAELLLRKALATRELTSGPDHPDTASGLNSLAQLLRARGDYAEAEPLYRRALEICERVLGPDHPDTASGLNSLAQLLRARGDYAEAEPLYRRALEIRERALGPDHPDTAASLNNLAKLDRIRGLYDQAEALIERALVIYKRALGDDHPDIAAVLNNLAKLRQDQGRLNEAERYFNQALEIRKKMLGERHPDIAQSYGNLAKLYQVRGDFTEAERLLTEAVEIDEQVYGKYHPDLAKDLISLAELF